MITGDTSKSPIETSEFARMLTNANVINSFFLPIEQSRWEGEYYTRGKNNKANVQTELSGLRISEPDPTNQTQSSEKGTQHDFKMLIDSIITLRKNKPLGNLVLSDELVIGKSQETGKRIRFGLRCPAGNKYQNERDAAEECHRIILSSVGKAGYQLQGVFPFDPANGLVGLQEWASKARYEKKPGLQISRRWLWLLLPLLLILCLFLKCSSSDPNSKFLGSKIGKSFIILLDVSPSMKNHLKKVQDETLKIIDEITNSNGDRYVDVITYSTNAKSAFGSISKVDKETKQKIIDYFKNLSLGDGTNLEAGVLQAAQEVKNHKKPTTLLVLTDCEDHSILKMIKDCQAIKDKFGSTEIIMNASSPRFWEGQGNGSDSSPANHWEENMANLCHFFNGNFGIRTDR